MLIVGLSAPLFLVGTRIAIRGPRPIWIGPEVRGKVLDAATGAPVPNARVRHADGGSDTFTDEAGTFELDAVSRDEWISLPGYRTLQPSVECSATGYKSVIYETTYRPYRRPPAPRRFVDFFLSTTATGFAVDADVGGVWEMTIFQDGNDFPPITASHVWLGNEVAFLIVPDVERAVLDGSRHSGWPYRGPFSGVMHLPNWTTVRFKAEAPEAEMDRVMIAERPYNLKEGRLFLVSSANGVLDVTQVDRDTRDLTTEPEDPKEIEELLRNVPEFERFMSGSRKQP